MKKQVYAIGDRVEKVCVECNEERGHVVASITKRGLISRVTCAKCGVRSTFKSSEAGTTTTRTASPSGTPYDWTRTYRAGQTMMHPAYGLGEVISVVDPKKIDVLFSDRLRRLVHGRPQIAI